MSRCSGVQDENTKKIRRVRKRKRNIHVPKLQPLLRLVGGETRLGVRQDCLDAFVETFDSQALVDPRLRLGHQGRAI